MATFRSDVTLDRWIEALDDSSWSDDALEAWQQAIDVMFDRTQQLVHIDTGELISSGSTRSFRRGDNLVGEVEYSAPYAVYEFGRGDSHDALNRAFELMGDVFPDAMIRVMRTQFLGAR